MDKGKNLKRHGAAEIIKYSAISGVSGGVTSAVIAVITSFFLENSDAPELYFDGVSWASVIVGALFGGIINGLLEKGRVKYSGAVAGVFAALTMLVFSAVSGGMTDGAYEPLKAVICIAASFLGGCTVSFSKSSSLSKGRKKSDFPHKRAYRFGR